MVNSSWVRKTGIISLFFVFYLLFSGISLFAAVPFTDAEFFAKLNQDYPGLDAVKAALTAGDTALAKNELLAYYRGRSLEPPIGRIYLPLDTTVDSAVLAVADNAMNHIIEAAGSSHNVDQPGNVINWYYDDPNNVEYLYQYNRHPQLNPLARAYVQTGDGKYAAELIAQMLDWIKDCPTSHVHSIDVGVRSLRWVPAYEYIVR